jgi:hypothetical protein
VVDYLWGRPTEMVLGALTHYDVRTRSQRVRLVQAGDMAGAAITLPADALRSGGVEILGQGTGTMPPLDVITGMLGELLDLLAAGTVRIDVYEVPLSAVSNVWRRDQRGRRLVFVP